MVLYHVHIIERLKRAHSLVMTFEIFGICMYICMLVRTSSMRYLKHRKKQDKKRRGLKNGECE